MTKYINIAMFFLVLDGGCKPSRWEGIPDDRKCGMANPAHETTCISGGKVYVCVRDDDIMYCSRNTAEVKCTNIVNVETVCPEKSGAR